MIADPMFANPVKSARLALCAALLAQAAPLGAGGAGTAPALDRAALAGALYAQGLAQGDALAVLTAARLRRDAALPEVATDGSPLALLDWPDMLAEARRLAADDPALLALIDDTEAERDKGVRIGPAYVIARIAPGLGPDRIDYSFAGGTTAEVYVEGAPGTNLDLYIRDEGGKLICTDTHPSNIAYCNWIPLHDATFTVTVENRGGTATEYVLITN